LNGRYHKGEFHLEKQSKMCHCHDNLALRPEVAKILKDRLLEFYISKLEYSSDKIPQTIHSISSVDMGLDFVLNQNYLKLRS